MPENDFDAARRSYQWYVDYDREDEYDKNPDWSNDLRLETVGGSDDESGFGRETVRLYSADDAEYEWIRSDTIYELPRMR